MRLVYMGTSEFAVPSLRGLRSAGHEVAAVVTRPDRPRRRASDPPAPSPVKIAAAALGVGVLEPERVREAGFADQLAVLAPEVIVVVAYGQILPPGILGLPPRGCLNLHASLLPKYRGAAPIARALMAGERVTGVTTMRMDAGVDTGDILLQQECVIGLSETAGELSLRLADQGSALVAETLERLGRGTLDPRRQNDAEATLAPPLTREDGRIDWSATGESVANRVRGCNPWPMAWTVHRGAQLQVLRAEVCLRTGSGTDAVPGQVIAAAGGRITVQCGADSRVDLTLVRLAGGRAISAGDAVNGRLIRVGETFGASAAA